MGRGCLTALGFVGGGAAVVVLAILWAIWINWDPAPPGDSGGRAMGTFAILITVVPVAALIAGAIAALIVWTRNGPVSGDDDSGAL